ncbi:MAG TPA: hypothetical protein VIY56_08735 [Vicinamibacterales bacterium]
MSFTATVAAVVTILDPRAWFSPSPAWSGLAPVALLYSTGLLIAAAPAAGAALGYRELFGAKAAGASSTPVRIVGRLAVGALAFAAAAAAATATIGFMAGDAFSTSLLSAHLVQGAAALALALGGAWLAGWLRNPLDAALWGVTLACLGSFGVLGAGTLVERLPRALVEWTLGVSPLMAVATAGQVDVLRTDIVYQVSPLAHVQMQLPDWPIVVAGYLSVAAACAVVLVRLSSDSNTVPLDRNLGKDIA